MTEQNENQNQNQSQNQLEPDFKYEILPDDYTQYDLNFKLIVIGDSGVGKSCLTNKATTNIFEDNYNATVGFEFFTLNIKMYDKIIKLQIWDTCGQELYRSLVTNFYRNCSLAIIVYAINSKPSFESIESWLKELRTHSNPDAKVFLIGNKVDLEKERQVTTEEAEQFKQINKLNLFMEASAKSGFNAQNIFIQAAKMLYQDFLKYKVDDENTFQSVDTIKTMNLSNSDNNNKKKKNGGCC